MKNNFLYRIFLAVAMGVLLSVTSTAQTKQADASVSVVDSSALTLTNGVYGNIINGQNFQQDALRSYKSWQYIVYYNSERRVCIGRRKLPAGNWEIIRFQDYYFSFAKGLMNDSHNTISMGFCVNDGTIHIAFDHHANPLHYRISVKSLLDKPASFKWEASLFSPVRDYLEEGKQQKNVTYPIFISTPKGDMLLGFRVGGSNDGDFYLANYDGHTGKWGNYHQILSGKGDYQDPFKGASPARNAYLNGINYDKKGRLHISWTWREKAEGLGNRDIGYMYSDDNGNTFLNNNGEVVTLATEGKMAGTNSPGIVIKELNRGWGMMNSQAQAPDGNGVMHILMYHRAKNDNVAEWARFNKDAAYFHYYSKADGTWQEDKLNHIGNRPKLVCDKNNNLYLVYVRKDHFDSKAETAPLVVVKATAKANWQDWHEIYVSPENYFNEPQVDLDETQHTLSLLAQDGPKSMGAASALKVVTIKL